MVKVYVVSNENEADVKVGGVEHGDLADSHWFEAPYWDHDQGDVVVEFVDRADEADVKDCIVQNSDEADLLGYEAATYEEAR